MSAEQELYKRERCSFSPVSSSLALRETTTRVFETETRGAIVLTRLSRRQPRAEVSIRHGAREAADVRNFNRQSRVHPGARNAHRGRRDLQSRREREVVSGAVNSRPRRLQHTRRQLRGSHGTSQSTTRRRSQPPAQTPWHFGSVVIRETNTSAYWAVL